MPITPTWRWCTASSCAPSAEGVEIAVSFYALKSMQRFLSTLATLFVLLGFAQATELVVYVTFSNDRAVAQYIRVQILDHTRNPIAEGFTNDRGQARVIVRSGEYRLRVTGQDIRE